MNWSIIFAFAKHKTIEIYHEKQNIMKHFIITGTSSGIGNALANEILKSENVRVIGISRKNTIQHPYYKHIYADFSENKFVENITFPEINNSDEIYLINNAGVISEIKRIGKISNESIINDFNVNALAPLLLINIFINKYQDLKIKKVILNISSGAGRHTVDAWTSYCSAKAAMDMYSLNISVEQEFIQNEKRFKIYSVAPGVVDTQMQNVIRNTRKNDFSELEKFIKLKSDKLLKQPADLAPKILEILFSDKIKEVITDVRNV